MCDNLEGIKMNPAYSKVVREYLKSYPNFGIM